MKKIFLLLAIMLPMMLVSCSDDDELSINNDLVGIWEEYGNIHGYEAFHIEFKADGTGSQWVENYGEIDEYGKEPFTWSSSERTVTVTIHNKGSMTMNYILDDDKLYLSHGDESIIYIRDNKS